MSSGISTYRVDWERDAQLNGASTHARQGGLRLSDAKRWMVNVECEFGRRARLYNEQTGKRVNKAGVTV